MADQSLAKIADVPPERAFRQHDAEAEAGGSEARPFW